MVLAFSLELNLPRYEGGVPPTNTSRAKIMVSVLGFEPRPHDPKSRTLPGYAIRRKKYAGAQGGIRTHTVWLLRPLPLPIALPGQKTTG